MCAIYVASMLHSVPSNTNICWLIMWNNELLFHYEWQFEAMGSFNIFCFTCLYWYGYHLSLNVAAWWSFKKKTLSLYVNIMEARHMFLFLDMRLLVTLVRKKCWQKFKCSACHFLSHKIWQPNSCIYLFWMTWIVINVSYEKKTTLLPNFSLGLISPAVFLFFFPFVSCTIFIFKYS